MSTAPPQPIALVAAPLFIDGALYGVGPQLLICKLQLGDAALDLGAWQARFDEWVVDAHPPQDSPQTPSPAAAPEPAESPERALLQLVQRWSAAIQREQNVPVFGACRVLVPHGDADTQARRWTLLMPQVDRSAALASLGWVLQAINLLAQGTPQAADELRTSLETLRTTLRSYGSKSTNMIHFVAAAHTLGLPLMKLAPSTFTVGYGAGSRWLQSSITDRTPTLGVSLARQKHHSAALMRRAGQPVPRHALAPTEERAVKIANELGYPLVVKPADQDQGRGVFTHLHNEAQLRRAWLAAREFSAHILVEVFHPGEDYRITVAHGRVLMVMHRRPAALLGDGASSVATLLAAEQQRPDLLRAYRRTGKWRLELDAEALELLAEQGMAPDAVPAVGQRVVLRRKANISTGGSHRVLPQADVHPDNLALAVRAAALLRLDLAGIDLISPDAGQPWHNNGAVICEVNAQPQLGYRDTPQLYEQLLGEMMQGWRAPEFVVLLVDGEPPLPAAAVAAVALKTGCNAWSSTAGTWLAGRQIAWRMPHSVSAAQTLLMEPELQRALLVLQAADVLREGLPVARLKLLAVRASAPGAPDALNQSPSAQLNAALRACAPHAERVVRLLFGTGDSPGTTSTGGISAASAAP